MKKGVYLFGMVCILTILGLVEAVSGFVLWLAIPSGGGRQGLEASFWGLTRHTWIDIHDWVAVALVAAVVIHLALHWKWVLRMVKDRYCMINDLFHNERNELKSKAG